MCIPFAAVFPFFSVSRYFFLNVMLPNPPYATPTFFNRNEYQKNIYKIKVIDKGRHMIERARAAASSRNTNIVLLYVGDHPPIYRIYRKTYKMSAPRKFQYFLFHFSGIKRVIFKSPVYIYFYYMLSFLHWKYF